MCDAEVNAAEHILTSFIFKFKFNHDENKPVHCWIFLHSDTLCFIDDIESFVSW